MESGTLHVPRPFCPIFVHRFRHSSAFFSFCNLVPISLPQNKNDGISYQPIGLWIYFLHHEKFEGLIYSVFDFIRILRNGAHNLNGGARLYRVRGRRPVLIQLEPVSWSQLAADGVFVLDTSSLLVLWLGRAANLVEKIFGAKVGRYQKWYTYRLFWSMCLG